MEIQGTKQNSLNWGIRISPCSNKRGPTDP